MESNKVYVVCFKVLLPWPEVSLSFSSKEEEIATKEEDGIHEGSVNDLILKTTKLRIWIHI